MKMVLKGCHRCGGDLLPDGEDRDGRTFYCLQCGLNVRVAERPRHRPIATGPRAV